MADPAVLIVVLVVAGAVVGRPGPPGRLVAGPTAGPPDRRVPGRRPAGRRRTVDAVDTLPELVDLLAVAAAAGLPAVPALLAVVERAPHPWRTVLEAVVAESERGRRTVDALDQLVHAHGGFGRPLAGVLRAAVDDGDALGLGLARLAADARDLRRRRAEETARRIPVRLLLPLVSCSLPAAAVLTIVPIVAGALDGLRFPA